MNGDPPPLKRLLNPKIIFFILGVVILVELFFALRMLQRPSPPPPAEPKPISGASITLLASKKDYSVGEIAPVSVSLFTGGRPTDGTDLVVKFDTSLLEATSGSVIRGRIYPEYPLVDVNPATGIITVSGITSIRQSNFNGQGIFATINFRVVKPGRTTVSVDFEKGKTADSNVVETSSASDILEKVTNLDLMIR